MLSNHTFTAPANRLLGADSAAATARDRRVERAILAEPTPAPLPTSFSRVADTLGVARVDMDAFIELLPVGVLLVDRDARVVYANEAARSMGVCGLAPLDELIERALVVDDTVYADEMQVPDYGPRQWLSARVMPLRHAGSGVEAALVTVSDATARRQMRAWNPVIESLVNL